MTIRRGANGEDVGRIQRRLAELRFYAGPIDGIFGGGTEAAVKSFQRQAGLQIDGAVGGSTWNTLFPSAPPPVSDIPSKPIIHRCLALTGSFETGRQPPECFAGITGDFDGQGVSFGVLQWNVGQQSLQPLLVEMVSQHRPTCEDIFHDNLSVLEALNDASLEEQLAFARSIQEPVRHRVNEPWRGMLKALGRTPEFQSIQVRAASQLNTRAAALCRDYGLETERGQALMFDICVQNGSISPIVKAQILNDFRTISGPEPVEVQKMRIIARRRAAAARPEFVQDVLSRKLCIAEGSGTVHGVPYDLEDQFGISLRRWSNSL